MCRVRQVASVALVGVDVDLQLRRRRLANQQILNGIEESRNRAANKFGVNSTPTFFINGKIFRGALTPEELDKQVATYLKG